MSAVFTVSLSSASGKTVNVDHATADGTATAPADYAAGTGSLTFTPGQTSKTVTVIVAGDSLDEIDETFNLNLSNAVNAAIADGSGLGTILDNDALPIVNVNDVTVTESDSGTVDATFTVSLNTPSGRALSVDYATANNTATAPADYTAVSGSLNFAAGETTKTVTVLVNGDLLDEVNETYFLNLANPTNATIGGSGTGTITDNDPLPALAIGDVSVTEGDSGTANATFTVTLSTVSGRTVTVDYATANGTAIAPADYTAVPLTALSFSPGQTTRTVTVVVNADALDESDETFNVNLSGAAGATIGDGIGVGTITDDDPLPALTINDVTVTEGDTGTVAATFTIGLSAVSGRTVTVDYATANGSAVAPADYVARSGVLTFLAGQTTQQLTVTVNGDTLDEFSETYSLNLSDAVSATIADGSGVGTIIDDDSLPSPLGQRRHSHRGPERHSQRELHGLAVGGERPDGQRRLRDRRRNGDRRCRLRGNGWQPRLQPGNHDAHADRASDERHARRDRRDLLREPVRLGQRDDRRTARGSARSPTTTTHRASRSGTSRSARGTAERRTRSSRPPSPRRAVARSRSTTRRRTARRWRRPTTWPRG